MPEAIWEVFKDKQGKFRFRLRAPNGEVIASSEAYERKESAINGIESVKTNANASIKDLTK
nr:YegP family protein [Candidatus Njordarchaeota archaeon]